MFGVVFTTPRTRRIQFVARFGYYQDTVLSRGPEPRLLSTFTQRGLGLPFYRLDGAESVLMTQPTNPSTTEVELTLVTMRFRGSEPEALAAVLSNYVVLTRGSAGCRNVDFCVSVQDPSIFVVLQKWDSPLAQQNHFDSPVMVSMAESCRGLLAEAPQIELLEGISAHDLN
jgi:quinol monooxygenase YgiN